MNTDDIRLNQAKRKIIKDAWKDVTWKRTPTEFDTDLYDKVANFKQHESDVWNSVIKPIVEKKFPPDKMKILKEFDHTVWDSCFVLKPSFSDDEEKQFRFAYNKEDMTALHYEELMNLGVNPNLELEYNNDKAKNPHYYNEEKNLDEKLNGFNNPRYNARGGGYYGGYNVSINESDVDRMGGFALLVSNTGGCHTRSMMCDNEFDWEKLKEYDVSRREMIVAQQKLYEHKAKIISVMNDVIDQAKFLSDVKPYWADLEQCVNFDIETGNALSIVSEDSKQLLLDTAKLRQAQRDIVAVVTTPKEKELV